MEAKCHVSPGTQIVQINWKRNGPLPRRTSLSHVSQKDGGDWTCQVAYNGGVVEATTSLQVKGERALKKKASSSNLHLQELLIHIIRWFSRNRHPSG